MYSHRWTLALLLMVLCAMQSTSSNAEPRIGVAASTRPNAEGIVGAKSQTLSAGSELYANETVRTGNRGAADLVFIDNSKVSVGSSSEVLLDKFDPTVLRASLFRKRHAAHSDLLRAHETIASILHMGRLACSAPISLARSDPLSDKARSATRRATRSILSRVKPSPFLPSSQS